MSKCINAAYRIRELLIQVQHQPNMGVSDLWAELFKISELDQNKRNFEISRCLNQLHDEIELVREQMLRTIYSEELFSLMLDRANNVVAVQNITGSWDSYKNQITPDLILCLGFCSEILGSEENEIPEEQIKEIFELLKPLEEHLSESNLPPYAARIIKKHVDKIKEALHSYTIIGAKALNEVVQSAYGEVVDNLDVFEKSKDTKEVKAISKVWSKIKNISDAASTVDKGVSSTYAIVDKATKLLEFFNF